MFRVSIIDLTNKKTHFLYLDTYLVFFLRRKEKKRNSEKLISYLVAPFEKADTCTLALIA